MGVEDLGFEKVQGPVGTVSEGENSAKENGKLEEGSGHNEPIKFGSHGDEMAKKEGNGVAVQNFPQDAVDEWPAPKQIHSFFFVRYRTFDDPKLKAKIEQANVEVQKKNQARSRVLDALNAKRSERSELIEQIKALRSDNQQIRKIADEKFKEIEPLQKDLKKLRTADYAGRNGGLCSSEEELNARIKGLQYIIQHESIPLSEEKKILKEIKQLENTRGEVIANAAVRAKIQESVVHIDKDALQDQVKLIGGDLEGVRKEQQAVRSKIQQLDDAIKAVDKQISSIRDELKIVTDKRDQAQQSIFTFRQQLDQQNASFYLSRNILNKARGLAIKNDVKALEELTHAEVEKFMSQWNSKKDFRDDYEKRILSSLDSRQLSRDGRIRNPDEKPLVVHEVSTPIVVESATKANTKQVKEDGRSAPLDSLPVQKVQKETKSKAVLPKSTVDEDEEIYGLEKPKKDSKESKVDEAKLKEMKREEEIAKAKQAMERKKKKAEKAAAKAEIRAQKEAEKKLKEREKKAKKKATSATESNPDEATEPIAEVAEPEKVNESVEVPVPAKEKVQKDKTIRNRGRPRGPDSLPKAILKRKKSNNYWVWAAPAALLVVVFLALGYYYLL
ncbi:proton pump-interactor 1 [Rosa sericea]